MATSKKVAEPKAAAKPAGKSTAVAVKKASGAVVDIASIRAQLAKQAEDAKNKTGPIGGNKIRLEPGKFVLPNGSESTEPLNLVVIDFVSVNTFYEGIYDPKNITPPACFAIGASLSELVPSDSSPVKQCDACSACPMNQFGSSGAGKACKNSRLLAVLPPDATEDTDMWILQVSPTALRSFDGFVQSVARQFQVPPVGVVVEVSLDPTQTYPTLRFGNPSPNEALEVCFNRQAEAQELLAVEPDVSGYQAPVAKGRAQPVAARRKA